MEKAWTLVETMENLGMSEGRIRERRVKGITLLEEVARAWEAKPSVQRDLCGVTIFRYLCEEIALCTEKEQLTLLPTERLKE